MVVDRKKVGSKKEERWGDEKRRRVDLYINLTRVGRGGELMWLR